MSGRSVLVTGAGGYVGRKLVAALARDPDGPSTLLATDIREATPDERIPGARHSRCDVRDRDALTALMAEHGIDTVVHLASIVTPPKGSTRDFEYSVDVGGTHAVVNACLATGVAKLIVTSSGAAYGYHADSAAWLDEEDPLRGNEAFAYSHHKRLVEEMLAERRADAPQLTQLIFRVCTVLGEGVSNQITALFEKRFVMGLAGSATPFVFVWDEDVVACLMKGIRDPGGGIYNLAGDGSMTLREIADTIGKPYVPLPPGLVGGALRVLAPLGLTRYGPEQIDFLRYRPVLSNRRLKEEFGYEPMKSSREAFDFFWTSGGRGKAAR